MEYTDKELDESWVDLDELGPPGWLAGLLLLLVPIAYFGTNYVASLLPSPRPPVSATYDQECSAFVNGQRVDFPCRR